METKHLFKFSGYTIIIDSLDCVALDQKYVINTISPNSYGISSHDPEMDFALKNSDFLTLDGVYFGLLTFLKFRQRISRITGWDTFQFLSKKMNEKCGKVFFLGSNELTLQKITEHYKRDFPNITVGTFAPPYRDKFSDAENAEMHKAINAFAPDVLFIGLTAPKQEKWSVQNKNFVNVNIIATIGNVFDWYADNQKRPSAFWQKIGLEWLIRIIYRPEIFRRNIYNQLIFFTHLLRVLFIRKENIKLPL
ncbi:MAG: WecB/TagA/CpsF family glycosyltransferase [Paludibacter sp.]|jgi:N-acetylglucosaminyldiphosphoundecaprenol N-acetyl-beta-D-mannosaminyltransferase|nr:WecB/TagA/CpsF family glycosyltransferase [Paludibacter sp.]